MVPGCGGGDAGAAGGGGPPSSALRTGFERLKANGRGAPPFLWGPSCVGMTREGGPSTGSGRTDSGSARAVGRRGRRWGMKTPHAAPLWIPAFAGTTVGVGGAGEYCWCRAGVPLSRDGRFANRPYGVGWESGAQRGLVMGVPRPCPSGFPKFTNEVQHQSRVLPWEKHLRRSPWKSDVRLPVYVPRAPRSGKSQQVWIARHRRWLGS